MAKANLDLCVAVIDTVLKNTVGIPALNVEKGRRPRNIRGKQWAFYRSRSSQRTTLVSGGYIREYEFEIDLFHREADVPEGTNVAAEMETIQEALFDAFNAKTAADFPSLTGLAVTEVEQVTRDDIEDDDDSMEEARSRTVVRFPMWESL